MRASSPAGQEVPLSVRGTRIGRDGGNDLAIDDKSISAHHCQIDFDNGVFTIVDRESTNGTFVNGKAVAREALRHGDEILVGHTRFYFLVDDTLPQRPKALIDVEEGAEALTSGATVLLNPRDSAYLRARADVADVAALQRLASDMSLLLRLNSEIHTYIDSVDLQRVLLERLFERIPAEYGAILLGTTAAQLLASSPVFLERKPSSAPIRISKTVAQQVFESGQAQLHQDVGALGAFSNSVRISNLRSILGVPLTVGESRIGVLYLSTSDRSSVFDERHLELAVAVAGIAAVALEHARYVEWLEVENRALTQQAGLSHEMIGEDPKLREAIEAIGRVAPTDSAVLILGESGTGKELAARAIHSNSPRRNAPFVAVNCGAIVDSLFASQLFGHVKGAFTGAERDHKGFLEEADGGTLFLDELADLPLHCQAALLRVLEEGKIRKVGSTRETAVNVRLISATNRPLVEEIRKGTFRADLFYRMGLTVTLPPLRERTGDIPLLAAFFLQKFKHKANREIGVTPPDTLRVLQGYSWPGNVRELARAIDWAVVFGKTGRLRPEDLPPEILANRAEAGTQRLEEALELHERQLILRALDETRGNVVEAAALVGRAPNYLQRRINQLRLRSELDRIRAAAGT